MSAVSIKNAIKDKLDDLSHLQAVYLYEINAGKASGFPFGVLTLSDGEASFLDSAGSSARNERQHTYDLRVFIERDEEHFGVEKAERLTNEVVDEINTAFDMDTTLSGACKWVKPVGYKTGYMSDSLVSRVIEFKIEAHEIVDSK